MDYLFGLVCVLWKYVRDFLQNGACVVGDIDCDIFERG